MQEWRRVMPLLAKHVSVVAVDLRGAGFSDCPVQELSNPRRRPFLCSLSLCRTKCRLVYLIG